jgi:hypothetical protein
MANIHGHSVDGDDAGQIALRHLDNEEALVLFDYAKHHGEAEFEGMVNGHRLNFTLIRESDGTHRVESREG